MDRFRSPTYRIYRRRIRRWSREIVLALALTVAAVIATGVAWLGSHSGQAHLMQVQVKR